jgi:deoxyribose-phosphate aldolase
MDKEEFASRIDHTLLDKDAPLKEFDLLAEEAEELGTNVCVPPCHVDRVSGVTGEVIAVVGFPHGTSRTEAKKQEAAAVIELGATEIDVAANVSYLKSGKKDLFRKDIAEVTDLGVTTKSIIETGLLSDEEKRLAARLSVEAGADYVKTCTGYSKGRATVEDVSLIKNVVGERAKIKASGGIGSAKEAIKLFGAGAHRIGASSGASLVREY